MAGLQRQMSRSSWSGIACVAGSRSARTICAMVLGGSVDFVFVVSISYEPSCFRCSAVDRDWIDGLLIRWNYPDH